MAKYISTYTITLEHEGDTPELARDHAGHVLYADLVPRFIGTSYGAPALRSTRLASAVEGERQRRVEARS